MRFRHILSEEFQNMRILRLVEVRDDRERAYEEASQTLRAEENSRDM
ncbi:MAG: hypothetical protein JKX93_10815 [Rhizobiaceae bacterium]|nr:hypothetical protein [Rhizobiaceae bacterium]